MTVLVATTVAAYKCCFSQEVAWLRHAELMEEESGVDIEFFVALERDARGDAPFENLLYRLDQLEKVTVWTFGVDDLSDSVTTGNRLFRICMGRNMAIEYALRNTDITHILYIDSDVLAPADVIPRLLELEHPVTGLRVGIYNMDGPRVEYPERPEWDVREHWNTAGCLMVERQVYNHIVWHYNPDAGQSDDPAFQAATRAEFGETRVRHDVLAQHVPINMVAVEDREGHDLKVYR